MSGAVLRNQIRLTLISACALLLAGCSGLQTAPPAAPTNLAPQSSVWLMSGRGVIAGAEPRCYRFLPGGQWQQASVADFLATDDPQVPTVVFAHGGRSTESESVDMGWEVYRDLASPTDDRPFRMVIYSWPASRLNTRMITDLRQWSDNAAYSGPTLAATLRQIHPEVPVCLVGHSFGASVVLSALETLSRGMGAEANPRTFRVTLLAPAVESDCFLPGRRYGESLLPVERMRLLFNSQDVLLVHYDWLRPGKHERALGQTGFVAMPPLAGPPPALEQIDLEPVLGDRHRWVHYVNASIIRKYAREFILFQEAAP